MRLRAADDLELEEDEVSQGMLQKASLKFRLGIHPERVLVLHFLGLSKLAHNSNLNLKLSGSQQTFLLGWVGCDVK